MNNRLPEVVRVGGRRSGSDEPSGEMLAEHGRRAGLEHAHVLFPGAVGHERVVERIPAVADVESHLPHALLAPLLEEEHHGCPGVFAHLRVLPPPETQVHQSLAGVKPDKQRVDDREQDLDLALVQMKKGRSKPLPEGAVNI